MSGVALTITFEDVSAGPILAQVRSALTDMRPLMQDIGAELENSTLDRFETNIAPDGTAWRPSLHSELTGKPTLVREGYLRDSVNYVLDGSDAVEVGAGGIAADYAAIHQTGGTITAKGPGGLAFTLASGEFVNVQSVTIPARPYLGISAQDDEAILEIALHYLADAAARAYQGGL
ncbi:MAG: phage virion morphogenesis protein [Phenylobacterium sp.]|uniref:phage virion morphogenesis protein n=1 Tax=Phenylobacterium sp. TaxID=1871053 RepID=UPI00391CDA04